MTTEEKARAYDEALKRADSLTEKYGGRDFAEYVFPELTESEDERIRKELISQVDKSRHHPADKARWIAYLEKQKEHPMPDSTELIEMWDKEKAMLKEKDFRDDAWRLAYNAFMDGFAKGTCVKFEKQIEQKPAEWSEDMKNELTKKHFDGYIMGREDTMRKMKDFLESHFNTQSGTSTLKAEEEK